MTNLFPLPYWAPALQRVPKPLQRLDEAFALGERECKGAPRHDRKAGQVRSFAPLAAIIAISPWRARPAAAPAPR